MYATFAANNRGADSDSAFPRDLSETPLRVTSVQFATYANDDAHTAPPVASNILFIPSHCISLKVRDIWFNDKHNMQIL